MLGICVSHWVLVKKRCIKLLFTTRNGPVQNDHYQVFHNCFHQSLMRLRNLIRVWCIWASNAYQHGLQNYFKGRSINHQDLSHKAQWCPPTDLTNMFLSETQNKGSRKPWDRKQAEPPACVLTKRAHKAQTPKGFNCSGYCRPVGGCHHPVSVELKCLSTSSHEHVNEWVQSSDENIY